jgi:hypothetical protein
MKRGANSSSESATNKSLSGLNSDEIRIVRRAKEEEARKGGWVRIFPTADSWDLYSYVSCFIFMFHFNIDLIYGKSVNVNNVCYIEYNNCFRIKNEI